MDAMTTTNGQGRGTDLAIMPVMDLATAGERYNAVVAFVKGLMHEGSDFGVIPGTNDKPVLLKPGAEKLCTFFGLSKRFELADVVEDWTGEDHGGEALFYYRYRCQLWRGDLLVAESDGSCNSRESKYRWRKAARTCPTCGAAAINKSKFPPRNAPQGTPPGWYCYAKAGGCGQEFAADAPAIMGQEVGRVPNPDIADAVNTCQKMAQKRALIAATLLAVNASEFFTQDMEDFVEGTVVETTVRQTTTPPAQRADPAPRSSPEPAPTAAGALTKSDPAYWEQLYNGCASLDAVRAVDKECPARFRKHPVVDGARQAAEDDLSKAAADLGDDVDLDDALAPAPTDDETDEAELDWGPYTDNLLSIIADTADLDDLDELAPAVERIPAASRAGVDAAMAAKRAALSKARAA